jgi:hypothetical protein
VRIEGRKGNQGFLCSLSCIEQFLWALSELYADGDCGRLFIPYSTVCDNDKIKSDLFQQVVDTGNSLDTKHRILVCPSGILIDLFRFYTCIKPKMSTINLLNAVHRRRAKLMETSPFRRNYTDTLHLSRLA